MTLHEQKLREELRLLEERQREINNLIKEEQKSTIKSCHFRIQQDTSGEWKIGFRRCYPNGEPMKGGYTTMIHSQDREALIDKSVELLCELQEFIEKIKEQKYEDR